jgi:hypothetical protein
MRHIILISLLCAAAPAAAQGHKSHEKSKPDVAGLYAKNCSNCHLPPDSRFAVDRAWIAQLAETS